MEPGDWWQEIARARGPHGEAWAEESPEDGPEEGEARGREESCRSKAKAQMKVKAPT